MSASVMTAIGTRPSSVVTTRALSFARFISQAAEATWESGSTVVVADRMSPATVVWLSGMAAPRGCAGSVAAIVLPNGPSGCRQRPVLRSDHVRSRPAGYDHHRRHGRLGLREVH